MALRQVGTYTAVMYRLDEVGDELPLHSHSFAHYSVVLAGQVDAFDENGRTLPLADGDRIEFAAGRPHGLRARTPGAIFLNLMPPVG